MIERLDTVTASVHSHLRMDHDAMTTRLVNAVSDPRVHVLGGHCTGRRVLSGRGHRPRRPSTLARSSSVRRERHDRGDQLTTRTRGSARRLIEIALEAGCLFAIDSDAHAPGQLEFKVLGARRAVEHDIDPDRIVTTWSSDRLLEWISR